MKDILVKSYNREAHLYSDKFKKHQEIKYNAFFNNNSFHHNRKVLVDFGCGTALLKDYLDEKKIDIDYYGVDLASEMIRIGREKTLNIKEGDICNTSYLSGAFDILTCFTVMRIIEEDETKILNEMARVLKPEGFLYLSILSQKVDETLYKNIKQSSFDIIDEFNCGQDIGFICRKRGVNNG